MKALLIITAVAITVLLGTFSSAASTCNIDVSLVNQDPVHVVPNEYVKVVFQVSGVTDPNCGEITFALIPEYPFSLDPGVSNVKIIQSGTYTQSYNSQATVPFTLRVDKDALDNEYSIKVQYGSNVGGNLAFAEKEFNISVEDVRSDFEVFVEDYDTTTNTITFNIVNIGKSDVDALSVKIPKQDNIVIKGANQDIIGSLDAQQDTTFSYEAEPKDGEIILEISYNDANSVRRTVEKRIEFDSSYFTDRKGAEKSTPWTMYIIILLIVVAGIWYLFRRRKKKQHAEHKYKHQ